MIRANTIQFLKKNESWIKGHADLFNNEILLIETLCLQDICKLKTDPFGVPPACNYGMPILEKFFLLINSFSYETIICSNDIKTYEYLFTFLYKSDIKTS